MSGTSRRLPPRLPSSSKKSEEGELGPQTSAKATPTAQAISTSTSATATPDQTPTQRIRPRIVSVRSQQIPSSSSSRGTTVEGTPVASATARKKTPPSVRATPSTSATSSATSTPSATSSSSTSSAKTSATSTTSATVSRRVLTTPFRSNEVGLEDEDYDIPEYEYDLSAASEPVEPIGPVPTPSQEKRAAQNEARLRANAWNESGHLKDYGVDWVLNNSLEFMPWVDRYYNDYRLSKSYETDCYRQEDLELFEYQKFVKSYMDFVSPYRGILLYHGLGSGKTRSAIEIARSYADEGQMCLFISGAKLISNFSTELVKWQWRWMGRPWTERENQYFLSLVAKKKKEIGQEYLATYGVGYAAYNAGADSIKQIKRYVDPNTGRLTDKVIIIDEVHNWMQQLHNGLNAGRKGKREATMIYYRLLMETENCRFITLTGTPIINVPSELIILFNILRGPIPIPPTMKFREDYARHKEIQERGYFELFPVSSLANRTKQLFDENFVDRHNNTPLHVDVFQRRIQGLVSYYSGAKGHVFPDMVNENGEPIDEPIVEKVAMSATQTLWYESVRELERQKRKEPAAGASLDKIIDEAEDEVLNSNFRVKSRMASNFGFPQDFQGVIPKGKREADEISALLQFMDTTPEYYFDESVLDEYSAKMSTIIAKMRDIEAEPEKDGGVLIYSNYREVEGIALMRRALLGNGFKEYRLGMEHSPSFIFDGRYFAILGSDSEENQKIIDVYNSEDNFFNPEEDSDAPYLGAGRIVKILLGTAVISEGINLFNIRQVHIMEPHWNFVRIDQTIGRARRICSHKNLPDEMWNFIAWVYVAVIDPQFSNLTKDTLTTDQIIYAIAEKKKKINDTFLELLRQAAVDCGLNASHNVDKTGRRVECMVLPPATAVDQHAYHPDLLADLDRPKYELTKVVGEKIKLGPYPRADTPIGKAFLIPELWRINPRTNKREPKYLLQLTPDNNLRFTDVANTRRYYLYDKESSDTGKTVYIGYLLLKPNERPMLIPG